MLFFCVWPDRASLLIDHVDLEAAKAAATEQEGAPPCAVQPIPPGLFAAHVYFDDDEDEDLDEDELGEIVTIAGLPHVDALLSELEDNGTPDEPPCGAEALTDDETIVRCELAAGDHVEHRCGDLVWT